MDNKLIGNEDGNNNTKVDVRFTEENVWLNKLKKEYIVKSKLDRK